MLKGLQGSGSLRLSVLNKEFTAGYYFMKEIATNPSAGRILFTDEILFAGAVKYMLENEDLLYTTDLSLEYFAWSGKAETYGLPLRIHRFPVDKLVQPLLCMLQK